MTDTFLNSHVYCFNPEDNGGESLTLKTEYYWNGDPVTKKTGIFSVQEISLESYCNSSTFSIQGFLTPEILRQLADELEAAREKAVFIAQAEEAVANQV